MEKIKFFLVVPILHVIALIGIIDNPWLLLFGIVAYTVIHTLGQNIGYHKLFSHKAFTPVSWYPRVAAFFGSISFVGDPLAWTLVHRMHHKYSDTEKDPHSPSKGKFHAYIGWIFKFNPGNKHYYLIADLIKHYPWMLTFRKWEPLVPLIFYTSLFLVNINLFYIVLLGGLLSMHAGLIVNAFSHNVSGPVDNRFFARFFHTICFHKDHHNIPNKSNYSQQSITDFSNYTLKFVSK